MNLKPIKRSKLRLIMGKAYYTYKRYIRWIFGKERFSKNKSKDLFPYIYFTHHTPLTVVERYRHSFDVFPDSNRTQPFGSGATCVYNYRDLMIKNETDEPYQLYVNVVKEYLYGEWRSTTKPLYTYEVYEKEHKIESEYWGGYTRHNVLFRKIYNIDEDLISDEYLADNHAIMMYAPFLEEGVLND